MKKHYLFVIFAAVSMLFATSCQEEGFDDNIAESQITFALDIENAINTRAISDGTQIDQLSYAIFKKTGEGDIKTDELLISKETKNDVNTLVGENGYTMSVTLASNQTYTAVFWAQSSDCEAYTVTDDMVVTVNYEGVNNDESRDAFFATREFTVNGDGEVRVVLRRPFAQVNVGAFPFDYEQAQYYGVDIQKSKAIFKGIPNSINLLTGVASGEVDVTYSLNAIPQERLYVDVDENKIDEEYIYLSMSYLLATPTSTTHEMAFEFTDANDANTVFFSESLHEVPTQRNWRTNIVGQMLCGDISFNIKIDPAYEDETINSAGLYYNFSEDTNIEDKVFAFNTYEAATFTSANNNKLTFNDVTFSGKVQYIAFGDYIKENGLVVVPFTNELNNVVAQDMTVTHTKGITNVEPLDYMAPLIFLRGVSTINNCKFTGAKCLPDMPLYVDYYKDAHEVLPYDCGVPNDCVAEFNECEISRMYAWSHSRITINKSNIRYIRCSTHNNSNTTNSLLSHLTIGEGSVVDTIFVTSSPTAKAITIDGKKHWNPDVKWSPRIIIKAGAKVDVLDMNNRSRYDSNGNLDVVIEEGATVGSILNEDTSNNPAN